MKLIHLTGLNAEFEGYVSDAGRGQGYWSKFPLMTISNLILVLSSLKFHGWCIL